MMYRKTRDHVVGCHSVAAVRRGDWETAWWAPGQVVFRKSDGTKGIGGHEQFMVLECNTIGCQASALVSVNDILAQVKPH